MGKFIVRTLIIALVLLAASFAVVGREGRMDAFAENRWTARRDPYDKPLQYVLVSNPGPADKVVAYERRHFGWPMWVLYIDSRASDGTWYAKLDVCKLAANFAAACVPALLAAAVWTLLLRSADRRAQGENA